MRAATPSTTAPPSVLLVHPSRPSEPTYPLGLAYLAGYLQRAGIAVTGVDLRVESGATLLRILHQQHFAVVGLRVLSCAVDEARQIIAKIRAHQPRATVVLGGPHPTLDPFNSLANTGADAVLCGDGEAPLLALAQRREPAAGVLRRGDSTLPDLHVHADLAELDFPDRTLFPLKRYYRYGLWGGAPRTALIATRGCTRGCGYCAARALSKGSFRKRSIEAILEELRQLNHEHQVRSFVFEDDNLLLDPAWGRTLFEQLARQAPGMVFDLPNGVAPDQVDSSMIELMARAGVRSLAFGIESLEPENQRRLERVLDLDHLVRLAEQAKRVGITTTGYFLLGLPADTLQTVFRQLRAVSLLPLDLVHLSLYQVLPGQALQSNSPLGPESLQRALRLAFYLYCYGSTRRGFELFARAGRDSAAARRLGRRALGWFFG